MPAPIFIDGIISAGRLFGQAYETIDKLINSNQYYTNRDVIIINQVRKNYLAVFPGKALPSELRYHHESTDNTVVLSATPTPTSPKYKYYLPPYQLNQEYSLTEVTFGSNDITEVCKNSVSYIHTYLNTLNKKAEGKLNLTPFVTYGHKNDGVRFVLFLLRNAFIEMSKLSLDEYSSLEEANSYIDFLKKLQYSEAFDGAMREIDEVVVQVLDGEQERKASSMLKWARNSLEEIEKIIKYRMSKCSIATQTTTLMVELEKLVDAGVIFSTYIISARKMQQEAMATSTPGGGMIDAGKTDKDELLFLQRNLRVALSQANPTNSANQASCNLKISDNETAVITDVNFYYDPEGKEWVGVTGRKLSSGVYVNFKEDLKQEFIRFCVQLKNLGDLRASVAYIKDMLGTGGDLIAVVRLAEGIRFALAMAEDTVDAMLDSQSKLLASAHQHIDYLATQTKLNNAQKAWQSNFGNLNALFPVETNYRRIISNFKSASASILVMLASWTENPQAKLDEFEKRYRLLAVNLERSGDRLAVYNDKYKLLLKRWKGSQCHAQPLTALVKPFLQGVQSKIIVAGESRVEELPDDVFVEHMQNSYDAVEFIKQKLTEYSTRHEYRFNLKLVEKSILLTSPGRKQQHDSTHEGYKNDSKHICRRNWFYRAFEALYQQESEKTILEDLQALIEELYIPGHFSGMRLQDAFTSRNNNGIENVITEINTRLEKRLAELSIVLVNVVGTPSLPSVGLPVNLDSDDICITEHTTHEHQESKDRPLLYQEEREMQLKTPCNPAISFEEVPFTPTGVIAVFDGWIRSHIGIVGAMFLDFWRKMTYSMESKNPFTSQPTTKKLLEYNQHLTSIKTLEKRKLLLTQVEEGLSAIDITKKNWALMAVKTAGGIDETDAKLWVVQQKEKLNDELANRKKSLTNIHQKTLKGAIFKNKALLAWSEDIYAELINTINQLNAPIAADKILDAVAWRLLHNLSADLEESEARLLEESLSQTQLDEYLCVILKRHHDTYSYEVAYKEKRDEQLNDCRSEKEKTSEDKVELFSGDRAFYLEIAKGLLRMRANPLVWMKRQKSSTHVAPISEKSSAGYFLVAAHIDLILSHLQYKASQIGALDLFLKIEFDEFSTALKAFADKLVKCVSSDNDLSWRLYASIFCNKGDLPKGARYERATLMWLGLEFFYTIVNEQLYKFSSERGVARNECTEETSAYQDIRLRLEGAKQIYRQAVAGKSFHYNLGMNTFEALVTKLSILETKISDKIKTHKIMWHNAIMAEEANREKEEFRQQAETLSHEKETLSHEKETLSHEKETLSKTMKASIRNLATQELNKRFCEVAISGEVWVRQQIKELVDRLQGVFAHERREALEGVVFELIATDERLSCIRHFVIRAVEPQGITQNTQTSLLSIHGTFAKSTKKEDLSPKKKAANASI